MLKIYCFGNPLIKKDRLALELIPNLKKEFSNIKSNIEFISANSPDEIEEETEIIIIDVVDGIKSVQIITDLDSICANKNCSLHDFDLGMTLKLMKKMGKIKSVKIIGIPLNYTKRKALRGITNIIKTKIL